MRTILRLVAFGLLLSDLAHAQWILGRRSAL